MKFARFVWKTLVAIKDGLVLLLLLLFFAAIYGALSLRPSAARVHDGALTIALDGPVVEEKSAFDPAALLQSGEGPKKEYQSRDLVRAIEAAADDDKIKAVVLDLEKFDGGPQVQLARIGVAMDKVRAAHKPVLVRGLLYTDHAYQLAAHASEIWVDPVGGVFVTGPGGSQLYYKALLDRLKINVHVFKVGIYKSAVEPYIRDSASPEARESIGAVLNARWAAWQADVHKARPQAHIAAMVSDPAALLAQAGGDGAEAARRAGLVDHIGDKVAFGERVGDLVGHDTTVPAGGYKSTPLDGYLASKPLSTVGKAVAVVTIAGEIVDGDAGPGTAGGTRIADLIDKAVADANTAALVVRVDSPGGSVTAAERIRAAIARARAKGLPVVVSMANLAASGGYWVTTPAQRIFAEPDTITGSIGVFALIPSFEQAIAAWGVHADGFHATPLSGQPDVVGGLSPQMAALSQGEVDGLYRRFITLVGQARHKSPGDVDRVAQGRVWDGGTARQLGLVDQFGDLDDALAWAAKAAKLSQWHAEFLGESANPFAAWLNQVMGDDSQAAPRDLTSALALHQRALAGQFVGDLDHLLGASGAEAYCMACAADAGTARAIKPTPGLYAVLAAWFGRGW